MTALVEVNLPSPNKSVRTERVGLFGVHWTGGTYNSAVAWCCDPESDVSYADIIGPDGRVARLVPYEYAAWAMGFAAVPPGAPYTFRRANHASVSIALAGGPPHPPTTAAIETLIALLVKGFIRYGYSPEETWRIIGHDDVAVFGPTHKRAGQYGRKDDPTGREFIRSGKIKAPWLDLDMVRARVRAALLAHLSAA